ncbi:hypothetical protein ACWDZ8_36050 [Streptomyces sp. NPDC003233]
MSYGLGIHTFVNGEPVAPDLAVVREILAPYAAVAAGAEGRDFWIRAADGGEAEVFVDDLVIAVDRPHLGEIIGVIAELADRLGAVVEPGNGTLLCREDRRADLPEGLEEDCTFVPRITREAVMAVAAWAR